MAMTRGGLLVAAWTALTLAALVDWFTGDSPAYHGPPAGLHIAPLPPPLIAPLPAGVTLSEPPFGAGTILSAPQADRVGSFAPARLSPVSSDISLLVKLWVVNTPPADRIVTVDMEVDDSFVGRSEDHRIVLADGCLRLDHTDGPMLAFSRQAGLIRDDSGRLAIAAGPEPQNILRVGAKGLVYFDPMVRDPAVERRWHAVCGPGRVAAVATVRNIPLCRNSRARDARLQAVYDASLSEERRRFDTMRANAIAQCRARGRSQITCERSVPPPPPLPPADAGTWPELPSNRQETCRYPS